MIISIRQRKRKKKRETNKKRKEEEGRRWLLHVMCLKAKLKKNKFYFIYLFITGIYKKQSKNNIKLCYVKYAYLVHFLLK